MFVLFFSDLSCILDLCIGFAQVAMCINTVVFNGAPQFQMSKAIHLMGPERINKVITTTLLSILTRARKIR